MHPIRTHSKAVERLIARVRKLCMALPESSERLSHSTPTWFVGAKAGKGGKVFTMFADDHHSDSIVGIWCPAAPGAQAMLIESNPKIFFRPPYVGPSGWIGIRLDRPPVDWEEVAELIEESWRLVAPKRALAALKEAP